MKTILGLLPIFCTLPIWFYLFYKILEAINASELMWFLFWIYLPVTILVSIAGQLAKED